MRFILLLLFVAAANAVKLTRVSEPIKNSYIVTLKPGFDVKSIIPTVKVAGGRIGHVYNFVLNGFSVECSEKVLNLILNLPAVESVEENGIMRAYNVASWGLDRVDQRTTTAQSVGDVTPFLDNNYNPHEAGRDGAGVHIYIIDTGINIGHVDFEGRARYGFTAFSGTADDDNGHGTHCAGTAAGASFGVAKSANLVSVKVLNGRFGFGSTEGVISGVDFVAGDAQGKVAVASMSLGGGVSDALDNAVENLIASGVPTAVAAGNDNADACNYSPARTGRTTAVSVASSTSSDWRSSFSNYGTCVTLFAPGSDITSAWIGSSTATNTISGTSMACPHVAGALALFRSYGSAAANCKAELVNYATKNAISNAKTGTPNELLFVGY